MTHLLTTVGELESRIGKASELVHLKTIDHLDEGARNWIALSPMMVAGLGNSAGMSVTLGGGLPGSWAETERNILRLPLAALDDASIMQVGASFGSFFMLSSVSELVRVNGTVTGIGGGEAIIAVKECYFHCGKAMIRSSFWEGVPYELPSTDFAAFAEASRFLALATSDGRGHGDLSPKGDLIGMMARMEGDVLWFADRPGNKRIDSFRNIVAEPRIAAMLITPGVSKVMQVTGVARITDDAAVRARFAVEGSIPELATSISCETIEIRDSPAIARAALWPAAAAPENFNPAKVAVGHIKLAKGLKAKLVGAAMSIPGLVEKELDKDYKKNLF